MVIGAPAEIGSRADVAAPASSARMPAHSRTRDARVVHSREYAAGHGPPMTGESAADREMRQGAFGPVERPATGSPPRRRLSGIPCEDARGSTPLGRLVASDVMRPQGSTIAAGRVDPRRAHCRCALSTSGEGMDRRMHKKLMTAVFVVVLAPALLLAQKVSYDYNKSANFAAFKTYAHKDGTKVGQPLIDERIVNSIDTELAAKGLTRSDASPDVFVVYHIAFDKQKDISTYSSGYGGGYGAYGWGWGGGWGGGMTSTQVRDILVGTLVIDIADAKQGQLAWRGMGVKEVNTTANPEKRDKSIASAVKKIFKNYPPKRKDS
jgi:hypothetical protein